MATVTRPTAGYTPTNPITNATKYQDDSAANSPKRAINSVKVDGDINKAYDTLTDHDNRIAAVEVISSDGDKGDITVSGALWTIDSGAVSTAKIADDAVTFAKVQNIATARILGRTTASSGNVEELTVGTGLTLSGGSLTPVTASDTAAGIIERSTDAELQTGTATDRAVTPANVKAALGFTKSFESAEITFAGSQSYSAAHSLGAVPKLVQLVARCKTSEGGYTAGSEITMGFQMSTSNNGIMVAADATNIGLATGTSMVFGFTNPSTNAGFTPTSGNWRFVVKAWG